MMTAVACPVCGRAEVEGTICPNCTTDLSVVRMLQGLPAATPAPEKSPPRKPWAWEPVAAACILGVAVGGLAFQRPSTPIPAPAPLAVVVAPSAMPSPIAASPKLTGIIYKVRSGDSLWLIAERLYGDGALYPHIRSANPTLQSSRPLHVGERLRLPNLEETHGSL